MHSFGIIFDIDGVLVHGGRALPGAREALEACHRSQIPNVFLTNNAMDTEEDRTERLRTVLDLPDLAAARMIVAHTPLGLELDEVKRGLVLCTGYTKRDIKEILTAKGFENVRTVAEFARERPHLMPNKLYPGQDKTSFDDPGAGSLQEDKDCVTAVVIVENPVDWHEDLQVLVDVLRSNGRVGSDIAAAETTTPQAVKLYCCNFDFVYATQYPVGRFGPGAFMRCLEALFREATGGRELVVTRRLGKPFRPAYAAAEARLRAQTADGSLPGTIFCIGDNPKSDVRGARHANDDDDYDDGDGDGGGDETAMRAQYRSILVRTGVFQDRRAANDADDPADFVVEDVAEAMALIRKLTEEAGDDAVDGEDTDAGAASPGRREGANVANKGGTSGLQKDPPL